MKGTRTIITNMTARFQQTGFAADMLLEVSELVIVFFYVDGIERQVIHLPWFECKIRNVNLRE